MKTCKMPSYALSKCTQEHFSKMWLHLKFWLFSAILPHDHPLKKQLSKANGAIMHSELVPDQEN